MLRVDVFVFLSHFPEKSFSVRALHNQGVGVIKCSDMFTFYPLFKHNEIHAWFYL